MGLEYVELILGWEDAFDIKISDPEAIVLRTPAMVIELISDKLNASDNGICLTQRVFHRLRSALLQVTDVERNQINIGSKLRNFLPHEKRLGTWKSICSIMSIPKAPRICPIFPEVSTVKEFIVWASKNHSSKFLETNEIWTRNQVRTVVRSIIKDVLGLDDFKDSDDFVRDLGVG